MSEVNMTVGTPWKHIINFSFPILVGAILQQLYTTVDTIIVGNFTGQEALSAVGTTNTMVFFFLSAAIGFSAGNGVLAAQHYGAGELDKVREDASSGMVFLLCTGLLSGFGGIIFSRWLYVEFVAVPAEILDRTLVYFRIYCLGMIFQFGYNAIASILRSLGDSAATLYFLCLASLLNILLDLLFVALLQWSVAGAAIATNISQAAAMAAAWIYMHRKYPFLRFRFSELKWQHNVVRETVRIGWPISLQMMIVALGITFIQRAVNGFGQVMTAAFTVGHRIEMYLHMPCNAMMTALATFTGQNIGAKKTDRVCRGARD